MLCTKICSIYKNRKESDGLCPNHVKTVIKFSNLTKNDIDIILQLIATPVLHTSEGEIVEYGINFNKIIPEPTTIEECPERYLATVDYDIIEETDDKPWFNWYDWHIDYWGTKWNAYGCYTLIGKSWIKFVFSTAWNVASPVIHRLDLLGYDMNIKFADEDLGSNCGEMTYSRKAGWTTFCDKSYTFAKNLWDKY